MSTPKINYYPSEAEISDIITYMQIMKIFISDDDNYEMTCVHYPKESQAMNDLIKKINGVDLDVEPY